MPKKARRVMIKFTSPRQNFEHFINESRPPKQKAYPQTQTNIKNYRQLLIPARAERASNTPSSDTPRWQQPQPILTPRRRTISRM